MVTSEGQVPKPQSLVSLQQPLVTREKVRVPVGDCRSISLFGSQCLHRIEARCTPRGNKTCDRGHREQHCGNYGKNRRIERLDLIEQVTHQPAGFQACSESHGETEDCRPHSIYQHLPHHVLAPCAQRNADADFGGPLPGDVGHDAEESHRGQQQ